MWMAVLCPMVVFDGVMVDRINQAHRFADKPPHGSIARVMAYQIVGEAILSLSLPPSTELSTTISSLIMSFIRSALPALSRRSLASAAPVQARAKHTLPALPYAYDVSPPELAISPRLIRPGFGV